MEDTTHLIVLIAFIGLFLIYLIHAARTDKLDARIEILESLLQKAIAENLGLTPVEAIAAVDRSVAADHAYAAQQGDDPAGLGARRPLAGKPGANLS